MSRRFFLALAASGLLVAGCGRRAELEACNIARRPCQEDIYYAVMRLRGDGFDPFQGVPPIRTITLAEYKKELLAQDAMAGPTTDQTPKVDPWSVALQLLGLVTPSTSVAQASIDDRVKNVAAFYSSATRDVTVIDRGDKHNDASDTTLLAHELVHAFQNSEKSAGAASQTTDGSFADLAMIEGEAVLYEHLAGAELQHVAAEHLDWEGYYGGWADGLRSDMAKQASPFYAVSWFIYPFGADLLTRAWLKGGNAAVRRLGTDFPQHAFDFMASLVHAKTGTAPRIACQIDAPNKTFALAGLDRFGAMQLYAFLGVAGLNDGAAWARALHWRDDALWVYFDDKSEQVALSWRIRMADGASADAVVAATTASREALPMLKASRDGNDVLLVASDNADLLDSWTGAQSCKP
jgi:hypothetical protein